MARHLTLALVLGLALTPARAGTLEVELSDLWPGGVVRVDLYADARSWDARRPMASQTLEASGTRCVVRFDGLPPGRYAVTAQERSRDVRWLKSAALRRGTSGSAFGRRRPFAAAAVEVKEDPKVHVRLVEAIP